LKIFFIIFFKIRLLLIKTNKFSICKLQKILHTKMAWFISFFRWKNKVKCLHRHCNLNSNFLLKTSVIYSKYKIILNEFASQNQTPHEYYIKHPNNIIKLSYPTQYIGISKRYPQYIKSTHHIKLTITKRTIFYQSEKPYLITKDRYAPGINI
jgi:hypothetical protein